MKERQKTVLIATTNFWHSPSQIGAHHYAKQFAENGYKVAFISCPISPLHFISSWKDPLFRERFRLWSSKGEWVNDRRIWTYVPMTLVPISNYPLLRSKWAINNSHRFFVPPLKRLLKNNGFDRFDILWIDSIPMAGLMKDIEYNKSIFRMTDNSAGFKFNSDNVLRKERELINDVDNVIVTARQLQDKVRLSRKRGIVYIPNGVEYDVFSGASRAVPADLNMIPSPRAIYVGAIEDWFDEELVAYAADKLRDVSFVLIGNAGIKLPNIGRCKNIYLLGKKKYNEIPGYLYNSSVGIIPFKYSSLTDTINPLKLYEYMACGLPVVSVKWKELENMASPAILTKTKDEFVSAVKLSLMQKEREKYQKYAKANSWDARFDLVKSSIIAENDAD